MALYLKKLEFSSFCANLWLNRGCGTEERNWGCGTEEILTDGQIKKSRLKLSAPVSKNIDKWIVYILFCYIFKTYIIQVQVYIVYNTHRKELTIKQKIELNALFKNISEFLSHTEHEECK